MRVAGQDPVWECSVDGTWQPYPKEISQQLEKAYANRGDPSAQFSERGQRYAADTKAMEQVNLETSVTRAIRRVFDFAQPETWSAQTPGQNCMLVDVNRGTPEFAAVRDRMAATMADAHRRIKKVQRVQNVLLWEYYCMRKELMKKRAGGKDPKEVAVWHGTRRTDPQEIYKDRQDGFMMQHSKEGMWGRGIYFAEKASYSDTYAHTATGDKVFMLTKLLSGEEVRIMPADGSLKVCPDKPGGGRYDTVTGDTSGSKVYIVYENGRAYPEYLVTYRLV